MDPAQRLTKLKMVRTLLSGDVITEREAIDRLLEVLISMTPAVAKVARFSPPTPDEVREYAASLKIDMDGEPFCNFYEAKGWMVGKNKMKSWQAAVRGWISRGEGTPIKEEISEDELITRFPGMDNDRTRNERHVGG